MSSFIKPSILAIAFLISITGCNIGNNPKEQTVTDIDGNVYTTVQIGTQVWMVENLKTTRYNDGTPIPLIEEGEKWRHMTSPARCWYDNSETTFKNTYGALYNWYAVGSGKICPEGWHVPTEEDWELLKGYLMQNGFGQGEGHLIGKSLASSKGWKVSPEPNAVGNNQSINNRIGFKGYPAGIRFSNGEFRHMYENAKWWSANESSESAAFIRFLSFKNGELTKYANRKENGFSIRCVRDKPTAETKVKSEAPRQIEMREENAIAEKPEIKTPQNNHVFISSRWDSLAASAYILKDLTDTTGWSWDYVDYVSDMEHTNIGIFDMNYHEMNYKLGLSFSSFFMCPPYCGGPVFNIHEFRNTGNGWYLTRKTKGFTYFKYWEDFQDSGFFPLTDNKYGMWIQGKNVNPRADPSMYSLVNVFAFEGDEFKSILYETNHYNDIAVRAFEYNNKSFVRITKTLDDGASEDNYVYENGRFSEYTGSFRSLSYEELSRAGYLDHGEYKESGICPTCKGTGLCPLCGGKGEVEHGIMCNCVRAYQVELASGHEPTTVPYKCPRCKGTGVY